MATDTEYGLSPATPSVNANPYGLQWAANPYGLQAASAPDLDSKYGLVSAQLRVGPELRPRCDSDAGSAEQRHSKLAGPSFNRTAPTVCLGKN